MLSFATPMEYTGGTMSAESEHFSDANLPDLDDLHLDFEYSDPTDASLEAWRKAGSNWSRLLLFAYRTSREKRPEVEEWLNTATGEYVNAFIGVTDAVKDSTGAPERALSLLNGVIAIEDAQLIGPVNQHFRRQILAPLPTKLREQIILPFADPDGAMPVLDGREPMSPSEASNTYYNELLIRTGSVLFETSIPTTPDKRRTSRKILGAIGVGSLLSLGFLAKRRRA
jgi:hypothetical protein